METRDIPFELSECDCNPNIHAHLRSIGARCRRSNVMKWCGWVVCGIRVDVGPVAAVYFSEGDPSVACTNRKCLFSSRFRNRNGGGRQTSESLWEGLYADESQHWSTREPLCCPKTSLQEMFVKSWVCSSASPQSSSYKASSK